MHVLYIVYMPAFHTEFLLGGEKLHGTGCVLTMLPWGGGGGGGLGTYSIPTLCLLRIKLQLAHTCTCTLCIIMYI